LPGLSRLLPTGLEWQTWPGRSLLPEQEAEKTAPNVAADLVSGDVIFEFNPEERFEFALDLMISGMEKFAARASQTEAAPE
jgi:hypothetical protein